MSNLSQESKQDALAQLCFLKAWAYFNLVRNYGPVPIFRKSISEGEAMSQPRASVSDVYAHIIELLEQAEGMYSKMMQVSWWGMLQMELLKHCWRGICYYGFRGDVRCAYRG